MKRMMQYGLFTMAFMLAVQVAHAALRPLYLYTGDNTTAYLIKHDDATAIPTTWGGSEVTYSRYYTGDPIPRSQRLDIAAERFVVDPSFADYEWTSTAYLFHEFPRIERFEGLEHIKVNASTTSTRAMFAYNNSLTSLNLAHFNTVNVTDMAHMFTSCGVLTSLDISHFHTANVTNMSYMFSGCNALSSLEISGWNTANVQNMEEMFARTNLTSLDLSRWNTSNLINAAEMFAECYNLRSLNLSGWNTANLESIGAMFHSCWSLSSLNISGWNTPKLNDMEYAFAYCRSLPSLELSHLNTANVTNMGALFFDCTRLTSLGISGWDVGRVEAMHEMFAGCVNLTSLDLSRWNTARVTDGVSMFADCRMLKTLKLPEFTQAMISSVAEDFLTTTHNLEYLDMTRSKNLSQEKVEKIVENITNPFTLVYLPEGRTYIGRSNIVTNDGTNFHCVEYVVADDTLTRYTDNKWYQFVYESLWTLPSDGLHPNQNSSTALKWEVNIPYGFTADKVTNTRKIGAKTGSAYTWFMPYSSPIPAGVEVYEFKGTTVDGIVATFVRSTDTELKAQKPYLVKCTAGEVSTSVNATSEVLAYTPGNDVEAAETSNGWNFIGSFQWRTTQEAAEAGLHTLQTGNKWKHYEGSTARPRPFRAFLKKAGSGARELSVNFEDGSGITGIEKIELLDGNTPENNSIYDLNGRYLGTRRDVLPTGTYIIGGKTTRI